MAGGVSSLGPSGTNNPYTTTLGPVLVPPEFGPPTVGSLGPLGYYLNHPLESTPSGLGLQSGYDAFRQAFVHQLPQVRQQLDTLAHRGIGG